MKRQSSEGGPVHISFDFKQYQLRCQAETIAKIVAGSLGVFVSWSAQINRFAAPVACARIGRASAIGLRASGERENVPLPGGSASGAAGVAGRRAISRAGAEA